ncbi:MAG: methyl-accepting chemotaxis protein [Desulfuromonadia bacterium]
MMEDSSLSDVSRTLSRWRDELVALCDRLRWIASGSEQTFLAVGGALQGYQGRSEALTDTARGMTRLLSGSEQGLIVSQLRSMLEDVERYLLSSRRRTEAGRDSLAAVKGFLWRVLAPLEGFGKMNKTLRMLSIATKIESARLGSAGMSFVTLAMDVEKLSHEVSDKSDSIRGCLNGLLQLIDESIERVSADTAAKEQELSRVMEMIRENLDRLEDLHRRFTEAGETVTTVSDEVAGSIGDVVAALQTHDIIRQQIEHVVEALERLAVNILSLPSPGDDSMQPLVVECGDVCELQHAQLSHAVDEFVEAVEAIRSILSDGGERLGEMVAGIQNVSGVMDREGGGSVVDDVANGVRDVGSFLDDCRRLDRDMELILHRVSDTVGQITSFVIDIRSIGSEIDLIALNSQIRAVHAGSEGAALAVLAEAIKRLSDEAVERTSEISNLLTMIDGATHRFDPTDDGDGEVISGMNERLDSILGRLSGINGEIVSRIRRVAEDLAALDADIRQITASFCVDDEVRGGAVPLLETLQRIVRESRAIHPPSEEFRENLRSLERRYTMESERRIHDIVLRRRGGTPLPSGTPEGKVATLSGEGGEFGDNVELF